ncbi:hypothetical protein KP509_09G045900 [Ceratopteris richardii]|nr:hypothetical protein KP509_09G045900 [Ceratopteris richardii]KAH7429390.1 hypothetical protein KP509_09G045900 [Ceratopteris richardii]
MLRLIEEDADSFAKRAEMFYQKRPELVNLVEEFYRAYRSLAERYDYLTGEIRHNLPKSVQGQFGLSSDSFNNMGNVGGHHPYSPLRKRGRTIEKLLNAEGELEDETGENVLFSNMETPENIAHDHRGPNFTLAYSNGNGHSACTLDFHSAQDNFSSQENLLKGYSSDSEADTCLKAANLEQEIENLKRENELLADSHRRALNINEALKRKVEALENQCRTMEKAKLEALKDNTDLILYRRDAEDASPMPVVCKKRQDDCFVDVKDNGSYFGIDFYSADHSNFKSQGPDSLHVTDEQTQENSLHRNLNALIQENQILKQTLLEREEEKKQAIRQLCISIDMLRHEKETLRSLLLTRGIRPNQPGWMKYLCLGD